MIQSISGFHSGAAQSAAAAGAKGASRAQKPEQVSQTGSRKPVVDEYVPEEKREPSGRYWPGQDEDGQPKIYFDDPEKKAETCTGNTDQVDRELEALKAKRTELEQRISSEADDTRRKELEQELAQVESELRQKDNDTYRRQHTVFS